MHNKYRLYNILNNHGLIKRAGGNNSVQGVDTDQTEEPVGVTEDDLKGIDVGKCILPHFGKYTLGGIGLGAGTGALLALLNKDKSSLKRRLLRNIAIGGSLGMFGGALGSHIHGGGNMLTMFNEITKDSALKQRIENEARKNGLPIVQS